MFHNTEAERERTARVDLGTNEAVQRAVLRSLAELNPLMEKVDGLMRVLGYPGKDLFAVRLAVGEAVLNAFRHGNQSDPRKVVRVRYLLTAAEVIVEVEDEGTGFDPNRVPDLFAEESTEQMRSRGLFLMRVYMSGVSFNRQGNRVTLCRRRSNP
jgi:serine/threonine-protein kinase RsbW